MKMKICANPPHPRHLKGRTQMTRIERIYTDFLFYS
jgi:hypothetical protein